MGTFTRRNYSMSTVAAALNGTNFLVKGGGKPQFLLDKERFLLKENNNKTKTFLQIKMRTVKKFKGSRFTWECLRKEIVSTMVYSINIEFKSQESTTSLSFRYTGDWRATWMGLNYQDTLVERNLVNRLPKPVNWVVKGRFELHCIYICWVFKKAHNVNWYINKILKTQK